MGWQFEHITLKNAAPMGLENTSVAVLPKYQPYGPWESSKALHLTDKLLALLAAIKAVRGNSLVATIFRHLQPWAWAGNRLIFFIFFAKKLIKKSFFLFLFRWILIFFVFVFFDWFCFVQYFLFVR